MQPKYSQVPGMRTKTSLGTLAQHPVFISSLLRSLSLWVFLPISPEPLKVTSDVHVVKGSGQFWVSILVCLSAASDSGHLGFWDALFWFSCHLVDCSQSWSFAICPLSVFPPLWVRVSGLISCTSFLNPQPLKRFLIPSTLMCFKCVLYL